MRRRVLGAVFVVAALLAAPITVQRADPGAVPTLAVADACAQVGCTTSLQTLQTAFGEIEVEESSESCATGECCQEMGSICLDAGVPLYDHRLCIRQ